MMRPTGVDLLLILADALFLKPEITWSYMEFHVIGFARTPPVEMSLIKCPICPAKVT